jgi:hypothetical protein
MASDPHAYALDGFRTVNRPHACVLVIFGASGDLTKRKLIPAKPLSGHRHSPMRSPADYWKLI